jgi:integrase/recombinase XerD
MKLSEAIEDYLRQKRALGLLYDTHEFDFLAFQRFTTDLPIGDVTSNHILDFLNRRPTSHFTWMQKHRRLRMLFEFLADRGYMSALSMPQRQRRSEDRPPISFIYTRTQVQKLIRTTPGNQSNRGCVISDETIRTVLLTLYGTGALPREVLWLKRDELDLKRNLIFLCGNANVTPRTVPLNKDLHGLLGAYLRSNRRRSVPTANVFVSTCGGPLSLNAFTRSFARLRIRAGVVRVDGGKLKPRMRDFRQTFAVHRIAAWIEERADLNRMLPALSAYMGLGDVLSTQRFLFMTPDRFKGVLDKLSPYSARKHWRDDPALMEFLGSL